MTKLKQSLITVGGAIILFSIFINPLTNIYVKILKPFRSGGIFSATGPEISYSWGAFFLAFPFFLTLLEFFFKKPILERRPYLYIAGFFVLISLVDTKFFLATITVILLGTLPGTIYGWIKDKKKKVMKFHE